MEIIDISWPITENMTAYKDKRMVKFEQTKEFARDKARESLVTLSCHTGTHVDVPAHFLPEGETIESISLDRLVGPCRVVDVTSCEGSIAKDDFAGHDIQPEEIILLKTKNSAHGPEETFNPAFIYLSPSGARYLVAQGVRAVGIDYLGIERDQPDHETHIAFLEKGIPIIEGLRLQTVEPGLYFLCCLPLKVEGLEAAPARAILCR